MVQEQDQSIWMMLTALGLRTHSVVVNSVVMDVSVLTVDHIGRMPLFFAHQVIRYMVELTDFYSNIFYSLF